MMPNTANISVIIPYYNSDKTIKRALDSVLSQSLQPKEVLIIDDKSSKASSIYLKELLNLYRKKTSIKLYIHTLASNIGAGGARNYGWELSSGDLIAFLDSDDAWLPGKLETQYSYFERDEGLTLCGHNYLIAANEEYDSLSSIISCDISTINPRTITKRQQLFRNRFATSTVMLRKNITQRFEKNKRYSEDFLLWSEIISSGHKAIKLDAVQALYFKQAFGESGLSANMYNMFKGNLSSYKTLYKKRMIGKVYLYVYTVISFLKYIRRIALISIR